MNLDRLLHQHFGHPTFRPGQQPVIEHVARGEDALVVMPTGHGKSLCYQLPSLARGGTTLVISPLIALMKDQVDALKARGIAATFINSSLGREERIRRTRGLVDGAYVLVYVAPERFTDAFMTTLRDADIRLLAVDEAHCISQWGHDFRPDYLRLDAVRRALSPIPTVALTATATPDVQDDILAQLQLPDARRFITGFDRENLALEVMPVRSPQHKHLALPALLAQQPALVYCATRKNVDAVTETLASQGIDAAAYHAGLDHSVRHRVHEDFLGGRLSVVVATNAFGMGVDKANIRTIVHFDLPGTLEAYYQEIGRAGRDGQAARATLMYRPADRGLQEFFIQGAHPPAASVHAVYDLLCRQEEHPIWWGATDIADRLGSAMDERQAHSCLSVLRQHSLVQRASTRDPRTGQNQAGIQLTDPGRALDLDESEMQRRRHHAFGQLERMVAYGAAPCQRRAVLDYFGEKPPWERCDRCTGCHANRPMVETARALTTHEIEAVRKVLACMARMGKPFSTSMIARVVTGSRDKTVRAFGFERLSTWGILSGWSQARVEALLGALEHGGLVEPTLISRPVQGQVRTWKNLSLTDAGRAVMHGEVSDLSLVMPEPRRARAETRIDPTESNDGPVDPDLLDQLRAVRHGLARDAGVPAYVVASNRTLTAMASMRPTSTESLSAVHGMGPKRIARYGEAFVDVVRGWTGC